MKQFQLQPIGTFCVKEGEMAIQLNQKYIKAAQALDGFSHLCIIWWFSELDTEDARSVLETPKPYKNAPEVMGIFSTRSPVRPNPLALSTVEVLDIDHETGTICIAYTDAYDGTPVLDIKPYTPSIDRVENPSVPAWCSHWPNSVESSGEFDWEHEFLF